MKKKTLMTRALSIAMAAIMAAPTTAFASAANPEENPIISESTTEKENGQDDAAEKEQKKEQGNEAAENEAAGNEAAGNEAAGNEAVGNDAADSKTEDAVVFAAELAAPKVQNIALEGGFLGKYYRVYFAEDASEYLTAVNGAENTRVTINGKEVTKVTSFFNDQNSYKLANDPAYGGDYIYIDFTEDCFRSGEFSVEIKTKGYKPLQFKVKDGNLSTSAPEVLKKAPKAAKLTPVNSMMDHYFRLSFEGEGIENFIKGVEKGSVLVNGTALSKKGNLWNETKAFKLSNDPAFGGDNVFIDFSEDCFPAGKVKVEIQADGYEPLVLDVVDGSISSEEDGKFVTLKKEVDLGWSKYIVLDLEDGITLDNTKFAVDGKEIQPTKVTDDGNIVKWEVSSLDHKELTVSQKNKKQTIDLGGKGDAESVQTGKTAPDYFMLNGPVYVWDYHLRNFDEDGNVRVEPSKTTFGPNEKAAGSVKYYSPDAELVPDDTTVSGVKGNVELMFNYAQGTDAEKAFVDGITDVDLVSYNENKNTINGELEYTLNKEFPHGDHTVACINVPLGQTNLTTAGRYYLRVSSNGKGNLFPIHVVNSVVPSMVLKDEKVVAGQQDVYFHMNDMVFGITMPIYRVDLTDPDGNKRELRKIDEWYLIGDLFILYNNKENYLTKAGNYTLDIYANGFKPFSKTFSVSEGEKLVEDGIMTVDAISTASLGGSGGGSSDGGGMDTNVMNANLIINADLLINAKIIKDMGIKNDFAEGISERWDSMNKISVYNKGAETVYDAAAYFDAVNTARTTNKYLSFAAYLAGGKAETTKNRPYAVKQVLEDNLLGDITNFNESSANQVPDIILVKTTEKSVTLKIEDEKYLIALKDKGELFLNGSSRALAAENFTIDTVEKTLEVRGTKVGDNTLTLKVPGYHEFKLPFECKKELQKVTLKAAGKYIGENVTVTCNVQDGTDCDYMKYIQTVKAITPDGKERQIRPEGQETPGIGYTVDKNVLTIGGKVFTEDWAQKGDGSAVEGDYTIVITSKYYPEERLTVSLTKKAAASELIEGPAVKEIKEAGGILGKYYVTHFEGTEEEIAKFVAAIDHVTANGKKVDRVSGFFNTTNGYKTSSDPSFGGAEQFVDFTKDCLTGEVEVVLNAEGYKPVKFNVKDGVLTGNVKPEPDKPAVDLTAPTVKEIEQLQDIIIGQYYHVSFNESEENVAKFINAIQKITVNGKEVKKEINFFNTTNGYKPANDPSFGGDDIYLEFTKDCFEGKVEVVISAKGYKDLKFNVKDGVLSTGDEGGITPDPVVPAVDKQALKDAVKANEDANKAEDYTEESWKDYTDALDAAKKVLNDDNADQDAVDAAVRNLNAATAALNKKPADPQNPDPQNPDPQNPDPQNPDPQNPDSQNPDSTDPADPAKPANPADPAKPANPANPAKPANPTKPVNPAKPAPGKKPAAKKPASPKTADNSNVFGMLALMISAAGAVVVTIRRKENDSLNM